MNLRALNLLRSSLHYRREAFDAGLRAAGFDVVPTLPDPRPGDLVLIWNRYGGSDEAARHFERRGARVLVAENGWLGKGWRGGEWFAMSLGHHAGAGKWNDNGPGRWDGWGVELAPYRTDGDETVILGQRAIGEPGIRSPNRWAQEVRGRIGRGRIREHPGTGEAVPLAHDLRNASEVVTWHSGAALLALMMGIPVWFEFDRWIGAMASRPLTQWGKEPQRDEAKRLACFQRMAWAMWQLDEVRSGEAIRCLLS